MNEVTLCVWFDGKAKEAAKSFVAVIKGPGGDAVPAMEKKGRKP